MSKLSNISVAVAFFCMVGPTMAQDQSSDLPAGPGKAVVQSVCTACHKTNQITRSSGYSHAGWRALIGTMIDLSGSPEQAAITAYLATHFPKNARRKPKLIPGSASISFKVWTVPTLGQRSRDPVQAPDGSIWWAGQWGNLIGRIDPKSGDMQEYPLPENAMPHSVTLDQQGNVWYMGNKSKHKQQANIRVRSCKTILSYAIFETQKPLLRSMHD